MKLGKPTSQHTCLTLPFPGPKRKGLPGAGGQGAGDINLGEELEEVACRCRTRLPVCDQRQGGRTGEKGRAGGREALPETSHLERKFTKLFI